MGNWDRSECVLDAVMEDLRIRKAELDSRSAVISLNKLRENSKNADNSEDSSEENLKIEDYIREVSCLLRYLIHSGPRSSTRNGQLQEVLRIEPPTDSDKHRKRGRN
jgi:hypothetical protein